MRYIALILILVVASQTMPVVNLEDDAGPVPKVLSEIVGSLTVLPEFEAGEALGLVSFSNNDPVTSKPGAAAAHVLSGLRADTLPAAASAVAPGAVVRVRVASPGDHRVGDLATTRGALDLLSSNVIGIFGKTSDLRAILRRPDGRFLKVSVGDAALGGHVRAIEEGAVEIVSGDRTILLRMPTL